MTDNQDFVLVVRPIRTGKRVVRYVVSRISKIGQRYEEIFGGNYWAPNAVFMVVDVKTFPTLAGAWRFLSRQKPPLAGLDPLHKITFTGSINGPGFWPVQQRNGPLYAIVEPESLPDPRNTVFQTWARLK